MAMMYSGEDDAVKRGFLDVKSKHIFGTAYKRKYVVLRNSPAPGFKFVEIYDKEDDPEDVETFPIYTGCSVQEKSSKTKGRFSFEVLVEGEALVFCCYSLQERQQWMEAFKTMDEEQQLLSGSRDFMGLNHSPIIEYFPVTLVKNHAAVEIGHYGDYLLSIQDSSIVLNWKSTRAIAYDWPWKCVESFREKEGPLVLRSRSVKGSGGPVMEFLFKTDLEIVDRILKGWTLVLMSSIPDSDPKKWNEISKVLRKPSRGRSRTLNKRSSSKKEKGTAVQRAKSFTKVHHIHKKFYHHSSNEHIPACVGTNSLAQPAPVARLPASPPPPPPRPEESSSDEDDPDYAYIDENKVKGPESPGKRVPDATNGGKRSGSPTLDEQLKDLERSIKHEKKLKKRQKEKTQLAHPPRDLHVPQRRFMTLGPQIHIPFAASDAQDYLEPVPSKKVITVQQPMPPASKDGDYEVPLPSHGRSRSEPDVFLGGSTGLFLSQPDPSVPRSSNNNSRGRFGPSSSSPLHRLSGGELSSSSSGLPPPSLPPRPWRYGSESTSSACSRTGSYNSEDMESPMVAPHFYRGPGGGGGGGGAVSGEESVFPSQDAGLHNSVIPEEAPTESNPSKEANDSPSPTTMQAPPSSPPPPLPPRSPIKSQRTPFSGSISSSISSSTAVAASSSSHRSSRCPRCQGRKPRAVSKTVSLNDQQHHQQHQHHFASQRSEPSGSLPDLNKSPDFVPENRLLQHRQSSGSNGNGNANTCTATTASGTGSSSNGVHVHHHRCSKCSPHSSTDAVFNGHNAGTGGSTSSVVHSSPLYNSKPSPTTTTTHPQYLQLLKENGRPSPPTATTSSSSSSSPLVGTTGGRGGDAGTGSSSVGGGGGGTNNRLSGGGGTDNKHIESCMRSVTDRLANLAKSLEDSPSTTATTKPASSLPPPRKSSSSSGSSNNVLSPVGSSSVIATKMTPSTSMANPHQRELHVQQQVNKQAVQSIINAAVKQAEIDSAGLGLAQQHSEVSNQSSSSSSSVFSRYQKKSSSQKELKHANTGGIGGGGRELRRLQTVAAIPVARLQGTTATPSPSGTGTASPPAPPVPPRSRVSLSGGGGDTPLSPKNTSPKASSSARSMTSWRNGSLSGKHISGGGGGGGGGGMEGIGSPPGGGHGQSPTGSMSYARHTIATHGHSHSHSHGYDPSHSHSHGIVGNSMTNNHFASSSSSSSFVPAPTSIGVGGHGHGVGAVSSGNSGPSSSASGSSNSSIGSGVAGESSTVFVHHLKSRRVVTATHV